MTAARKAAAAKGAPTYQTRLASGEKQGRKRMATLGGVYDAVPVIRTSHDVITLPGTGSDAGHRHDRTNDDHDATTPRRRGPQAIAKWLTGSIDHSSEQVIATVFDQAEQRDPGHRRPWIALVDGAPHQLDLIRAEAWVGAHLHKILHGRADEVIGDLDRQAAEAGLDPERRKGIDTAIGYLTAKQPYLAYDTTLTCGRPIATGVIEGACRHLIGDRLDITGARWSLHGAEAVLKLRALVATATSPPTGPITSHASINACTKPATSANMTSPRNQARPFKRATPISNAFQGP
ncbi:hypothetical protein AB0B45_48195 [Nonomuraea sp. NPDC049152]|uniref:hypothetical protein n=1 Tax=Nonomuraea sp. NPDC049152 TaxID=3154350 RepID=UPI0033DD94CE